MHRFGRAARAVEVSGRVTPKHRAVPVKHRATDEVTLDICKVKTVQKNDEFVGTRVKQSEVVHENRVVRCAQFRELHLRGTECLRQPAALKRRIAARRFV